MRPGGLGGHHMLTSASTHGHEKHAKRRTRVLPGTRAGRAVGRSGSVEGQRRELGVWPRCNGQDGPSSGSGLFTPSGSSVDAQRSAVDAQRSEREPDRSGSHDAVDPEIGAGAKINMEWQKIVYGQRT